MKGKVVYLGERFFDAIVVPLRGRKTTKRSRVSRDSAGNFVNFNLYPCPRVLFIRLSATRALLTRQTKKQVISTRLGYDMHIRNVDRGYIALLVTVLIHLWNIFGGLIVELKMKEDKENVVCCTSIFVLLQKYPNRFYMICIVFLQIIIFNKYKLKISVT